MTARPATTTSSRLRSPRSARPSSPAPRIASPTCSPRRSKAATSTPGRRTRGSASLGGGAAPRRLGAHPLVLDRALELRQGPSHVPAHDRRRELLRDPAPEAAGRAELDPQLDPRGAIKSTHPPAAPLVDAGDRVPRQVALGRELDDLDQPTHLGRPDPHQHPVARAQAGPRPADALP